MKNHAFFGIFLAAAVAANAAETALVRVKWSEFVSTDKVARVMANAYVAAKPLGDAQAIPLHDAGKTIVYDWETGDADDLLAARLECRRGTWIYASDTPAGLFRPVSDTPATPEDMMALDGTLFMDGDRPYMVFCHEWVQAKVGGMCAATSTLTARRGAAPTVHRRSTIFRQRMSSGSTTEAVLACILRPLAHRQDCDDGDVR